MRAEEVIDLYIDDTVRLLPTRLRDDVAAELRGLLHEELSARAKQSGRPPDDALALSLVRGFGAPNEVAARYHSAWTIIDPADSRSFMRAAIVGSSAVLLLSALRRHVPAMPGAVDDMVALLVLAWLGLLVMAFGLKSWIRRRRPGWAHWKPRDRDRANRAGTAILVPIAMLCVILYAVPRWIFSLISGGRFDTSWAAYTENFQRFRLPWFIGCMFALLWLVSYVAVRGRWDRLTRRFNIVLNIVLACLILTFAVEANIFQSSAVDQIARGVLALVAAIYVPSVGVQIYGEFGRIDRAPTTKTAAAPD
jgi:hypothetical protein